MKLANRIKNISRLEGKFTLRSGAISNTYFDKYLFESDPVLLRDIATEMVRMVPAGTEVLAGLEMGGIPVVTALSLETGIPAAYLRKDCKEYGTAKFAEGPELVGKKILLVEDVVSSGGAILNTVKMLRDDGVEVGWAICVIDRQTGGVEALNEAGVELRSLLTMDEIESSL